MNKKNNNLNLKNNAPKADKFTKFIGSLYYFIIFIIIAFGISVLTLAGKTIYDNYHNIERTINPNVLEELKDKYSKNFKIVNAATDEKGYGVYSLYYKEDKNVVFNVVKDKETNTIYDDFDYRYKKYYIDSYIDSCNDINIKKNLKIKENYIEINGCQILVEYEFWFEVSCYNDLENTANYLYNMYEYFSNNAKNPYILIVGGIIRQDNYISNISFEYNKDKEIFIKELQSEYKNFFKLSYSKV